MTRRRDKGRVALGAVAIAVVAATASAACGIPSSGAHDLGPTPAVSTTTPPVTSPNRTVTIYLTKGGRLWPALRQAPQTVAVGTRAMTELFAGPSADETAQGVGTAIPASVRFVDLFIANGVARVSLSQSLTGATGSADTLLATAQIVCTLNKFPTIIAVRFQVDGQLVSIEKADRTTTGDPVACLDYAELIQSPTP